MSKQTDRANIFTELHVKGDPLIIYNAWDAASAKAIAGAGAKAIATGDHPVAFAHGFEEKDFTDFTFDTYMVTIKEIAKRIGDLPLSIDINDGYGLEGVKLENLIKSLIEVGVVGINFEDQSIDESHLKTIDEQVSRIKTIRDVSNKMNVPLFINARTNLFITADPKHHASLIDESIERAKAYQQAGGNGFFAAGLIDLDLIKQLTNAVNMPVNIIRLPNAPSTKELAEAGVARISYGPIPQIQMIEWLKTQASAAIKWEV